MRDSFRAKNTCPQSRTIDQEFRERELDLLVKRGTTLESIVFEVRIEFGVIVLQKANTQYQNSFERIGQLVFPRFVHPCYSLFDS